MFEPVKKLNARIVALPFFGKVSAIHKARGQKILSALCLLPLIGAMFAGRFGMLGPDPWFAGMQAMGSTALTMLLLGLSVTPLVQAFAWNFLYPWRRTLGLFAFFYAVMHVLARMVVLGFNWQDITAELFSNPFYLAGLITFLLLIPLAATSTRAMMARLGGKRWKRLHKLVYIAAILAILHALQAGKAGYIENAPMAAWLVVLLGWRIAWPHMQKTHG